MWLRSCRGGLARRCQTVIREAVAGCVGLPEAINDALVFCGHRSYRELVLEEADDLAEVLDDGCQRDDEIGKRVASYSPLLGVGDVLVLTALDVSVHGLDAVAHTVRSAPVN